MLFDGKSNYSWKNVSPSPRLAYRFNAIPVIISMFNMEPSEIILQFVRRKWLRLAKTKNKHTHEWKPKGAVLLDIASSARFVSSFFLPLPSFTINKPNLMDIYEHPWENIQTVSMFHIWGYLWKVYRLSTVASLWWINLYFSDPLLYSIKELDSHSFCFVYMATPTLF